MMKKYFPILFLGFILIAASRVSAAMDVGNIDLPWQSSSTTVLDFIAKIINWLLGIIGALAVVAIAYSGILYITAGADTAKTDTAKKTLTWAITGLIISGLAYLIVWEIVRQFKPTP